MVKMTDKYEDRWIGLPAGILFDLDDTIITYDAVADRAWRIVCGEHADQLGSVSADSLYEAIRLSSDWYYASPIRAKCARMDLQAARREVVCLAMEILRINDPHLACRIADRYSAVRTEGIGLFPGAEAVLEGLSARGVAMALLTNGDAAGQRAKIERFGLERYFRVILVEGEQGIGKPEPEVYGRALDGLGVEASQAWMVGDNLEWDVAAPQRLGIIGVWNDYNRAGLPAGSAVVPDRIVHSISELVDGLVIRDTFRFSEDVTRRVSSQKRYGVPN